MDKNQSVVSVTEESRNTIENHLVTGPLNLTSEDEQNQDQPASQEMRCIICDEVGTESLKQLKSSTTLRIAAQHRMNLKKDMFKAATGRVRNLGEHGESIYRYHSSCNRRFCAVKRPVDKNNEDSESTPSKKTRSSVTLPTTNTRGVTQNQCILCTDNRKRVKGKSGGFERLCRVETKSSSDEITAAAQRSPHLPQSQRVLSLRSDDLIAQEAKYHNSCKRKLIRVSRDVTSTEMEYGEATARKIHDTVTPNFLQYVESEVIVKRKPLMVNKLMYLYKEEYVAAGGNREDLTSYSMQALIKKINNQHRKNVLISKDSNKSGNFIYPVGMEVEDAKALLKESNPLIETVKCAAMTVRSEILQLPKSKKPYPTSIHTLKMASPNIPPLTDLFFSTLLNGISPITQSKTQRKSTSLASDAVFSTTRGHVRPWKNTALGLGLSSMLGSKTAISILNRNGHTISYDQCKRLETEIAYSCTSEGYETPAGLQRKPMQSTGLAWDNFDLNLETLDGKGSLHVTVGIAYQNLLDVDEQNVTYDFSSERPRRRYDGPVKLIPPFHKNLKTAKFNFGPQETVITNQKVIYDIHKARDIDMLWLIISMYTKVPMFNGFFSKFVNDSLPITAIGYLDPISQSPTRNDVVRETMIRSQVVAHETEASYMPVTYDLAVALKAYSIQALEKPLFDNLVILLGNFHVELAFYGAMGTYIADSGIEYILTEAGVLAEGSLPGFLKGKHYNRCTRIHQLAASVLERLLFERFLLVSRRAGDNTEHEDDNQYQQIIDEIKNLSIEDMDAQKKEVSKDDFKRLLSEFEAFLAKVMKGHLGKTAAYWGTYIYLINRLHREMKRAIRMNDVELYKKILPQMIEVFFSLNRPNYARWGVLFQRKLETLDSAALDVLKAGAFSTRRTSKSYSRAAVDLTLEQSINCDAASSATGITHFGNSEKAFRRWCVNLSQRSMAVNAMKDLSGLQAGETPDNQLKNHRIIRDNKDMKALQETISDICNPFADTAPTDLVNIVTGKVANNVTKNYLTGCLQRGADLKNKFTQECKADESRLLTL